MRTVTRKSERGNERDPKEGNDGTSNWKYEVNKTEPRNLKASDSDVATLLCAIQVAGPSPMTAGSKLRGQKGNQAPTFCLFQVAPVEPESFLVAKFKFQV